MRILSLKTAVAFECCKSCSKSCHFLPSSTMTKANKAGQIRLRALRGILFSFSSLFVEKKIEASAALSLQSGFAPFRRNSSFVSVVLIVPFQAIEIGFDTKETTRSILKEIHSGSAILAQLECSYAHNATLALVLEAAKASLQLAPLQRTVYTFHSAASTASIFVVPMALLRTA